MSSDALEMLGIGVALVGLACVIGGLILVSLALACVIGGACVVGAGAVLIVAANREDGAS